MQLNIKKLIEEEERRLKVGDPEFLKRHEEIMKQCDDLEEGQTDKTPKRKECEQWQKVTPMKAIRRKCLDCCVGQVVEVRECTVITCPPLGV